MIAATRTVSTPWVGNRVDHGVGLTQPIASSPDGSLVAISQPVTIDTVEQSRVAVLSASDLSVVDEEQIRAGAHDTGTGFLGHRGTTVGWSPSGDLLAFGHGHHIAWRGYRATGSDVATLTLLDAPAGSGGNADNTSYYQTYTGPDGLWLTYRGGGGNGYSSRMCRWDDTAKTWVHRPGFDPFSVAGGYQFRLGFGSEWMWVAAEWFVGDSGFPRSNAGVLRSPDNGVTWFRVTGEQQTSQMERWSTSQTLVFSTNSELRLASTTIAMWGDDPIVFTKLQREGGTEWDVLYRRWDGSQFAPAEVLYDGSIIEPGPVQTAWRPGRIVAINAIEQRLHIAWTDDGGVSWSYDLLGEDATIRNVGIDREEFVRSGVLRVMPMFTGDDLQRSEVWEFTLPAPAIAGLVNARNGTLTAVGGTLTAA